MFRNNRGNWDLVFVVLLGLLLLTVLGVFVDSASGEESQYYEEFIAAYQFQVIVEGVITPPLSTGVLPAAEIVLFPPAIGMYNFVPIDKIGTEFRFRVYGLTPEPNGTKILLKEFTPLDFNEFEQALLLVPTNVPVVGTFEYTAFKTPEFNVLFAGTIGYGTNVYPEFRILDPNIKLAGVFFHQTFQPGPSLEGVIRNLQYLSGNTPGVE